MRRLAGAGALVLIFTAGLSPAVRVATASAAPVIDSTFSSAVQASSARLSARLDPNGTFTTYHFEYLTQAAYDANGGDFAGALRSPSVNDAILGSGPPLTVTTQLFGLSPATAYRYRVVTNPASSPPDTAHVFRTQSSAAQLLPDGRGWEMVSPIDKNGGQVDPPGQIAGGGVLQAAAAGGLVTYGSAAPFAGGQGAPPASQYLAARGPAGWATENITAPIFSGTYATAAEGVPYQLFSPDLSRGLLFNGEHCRGGASGCAVANPPLAGTDAPAGYQNYYLREAGAFTALLGPADAANLDLGPADFDLRLAGTSPDLNQVVFSTCAALTRDATEVPAGSGCDPTAQNLYEHSPGSGLSLINILPTQTTGHPGATLGAQSGAISTDGSRVYWADPATGDLYLREEGQTELLDAGVFQGAAADGSFAFYLKAEHLYRYDAATRASSDLTPAGAVTGMLGTSSNGDTAYYQDGSGLERWHSGTTTEVAPGPNATDPADSPPATGSARLSADGSRLLFLSSAELTGYDNTDLISGNPDSQVFLYDDTAKQPLACVSCNPTNERPLGRSSIPGAIANGTAPGSTDAYKPRVLSADGRRVLFESADSLVQTDTNTDPADGSGVPDVYQWEAAGEGSCAATDGWPLADLVRALGRRRTVHRCLGRRLRCLLHH